MDLSTKLLVSSPAICPTSFTYSVMVVIIYARRLTTHIWLLAHNTKASKKLTRSPSSDCCPSGCAIALLGRDSRGLGARIAHKSPPSAIRSEQDVPVYLYFTSHAALHIPTSRPIPFLTHTSDPASGVQRSFLTTSHPAKCQWLSTDVLRPSSV